MKCPNCGGQQSPSIKENFFKCNHCGTISANKLFLNNLMCANFGESVNEFEILNAHEDYLTLKDVSYNKIKNNPQSWLAYFYYAIAEYWLGKNDFKHLNNVLNHLNKAFQLSNNQIVLDYKLALINSAISLASCNKPYGEELTHSLSVFEFAENEVFDVDKEILVQKIKYCNLAIEKLISSIDSEIVNKKNNFDITYINLKNIFRLAKYTSSVNHYEKFYLFAKFHLAKNKNKTYFKEIESDINFTSKLLSDKNSSVLGKNMMFNFFGKLIIK